MHNFSTTCPVCGVILSVQNVRKEGQKTYIVCDKGHFSASFDSDKWPQTPENHKKTSENIEKR